MATDDQQTEKPKRNPHWSRDELILALDFYMAHRDESLPDARSLDIQSLSEKLNVLARRIGLSGDDRFRNANGVYMKLNNFRSLDPVYTQDGKVGLSRRAKGDEAVWLEFSGDGSKLAQVASVIRGALETPEEFQNLLRPEEDDFAEAEEGRTITRMHRGRERSRKLVERKKSSFLERHGRLFCEACAFDFGERYGERGRGFIECHHTRPVHLLEPGERTHIRDLALLCANCHRMVHVRSPWLSMDALRALLQ